jgi:3-methyladenine DNA glycosylase AlkD
MADTDLRRASEVVAELRAGADPVRAAGALRFFKSGPGEYGEGDRFLGVSLPEIRALVRRCGGLPITELERLLESPWHEARSVALLAMVRAFGRRNATDAERAAIHELYLRRTDRINNWDLVDCSAEHIVGPYLDGRSHAPLDRLVRSKSLWERRIAIIATFHFTRGGDAAPTLRLAPKLFGDREDLIHKATGWMLREVGKRVDRATLCGFLDRHAGAMPRTMLRYAIEHLPEARRRHYLDAPRSAR